MKARLIYLNEKTKELVQSVNDIFGNYDEPTIPQPQTEESHTSYLDLSKIK